MVKVRTVRERLHSDTASLKNGVYTLRWGFFYTNGMTAEKKVAAVKAAFPDAKILDSGEVWKAFSGGASVANQSHWFVKFELPKKTPDYGQPSTSFPGSAAGLE